MSFRRDINRESRVELFIGVSIMSFRRDTNRESRVELVTVSVWLNLVVPSEILEVVTRDIKAPTTCS